MKNSPGYHKRPELECTIKHIIISYICIISDTPQQYLNVNFHIALGFHYICGHLFLYVLTLIQIIPNMNRACEFHITFEIKHNTHEKHFSHPRSMQSFVLHSAAHAANI